MPRYANLYNSLIPQSQPLNERQVKNNAGGFVFKVDCWTRLDRFLILGSDTNTYYQHAKDLTRENAACVLECYHQDPVRTIKAIADVSVNGRAPKNDPAIFALALGASLKGDANSHVRAMALAYLPDVCRTATHLFQFVGNVRALGKGWGRMLKTGVARWYNSKPVDAVAFQVIKYRNRERWTHRDLMRVCHPDAGVEALRRDNKARVALYKWIREQPFHKEDLPPIVGAYQKVMDPLTGKKDRIKLITEFKLPWETLPTECNTDPDYWAAQLPYMGLTALIRNLGTLSRIGLIAPLSDAVSVIQDRLSDEGEIRKSRIHPFNVLVAYKTYASGQGFRGGNSWKVNQTIVAVLEKVFYKAFQNVEPTGKRYLLGLDVSGSMALPMQGTNVSYCEATAAMSLVLANTEPKTHTMGFSTDFVDLGINPNDTLAAATAKATMRNFGGTDCALPMTYAANKDIPVDVFVVMTDNETWAGGAHSVVALQAYRNKMKINAKLIVVGMQGNPFTIADPNDSGMLDVVGFDTSAPAVMAEFARKSL